jgi:hypothetical protein
MGVKFGKSTDQVSENNVLRISGPKREYIIRDRNFIRGVP